MLIRNNPELDYDALEADINRRLAAYRDSGNWVDVPAFGTDAAPEGAAQPPGRARASATLQRLYALEDAAFVRRAHRLLLGRNPTPDELARRLEALRAGENKSRLVYQLRYSGEGRQHGSGLDIPLHRAAYTLIALPVVGRAFEWAVDLLSLSGLRRQSLAKLNALQRELMRQADEHKQRGDEQIARARAELETLRSDHQARLAETSAELEALRKACDERQAAQQQALSTLKIRLTALETGNSPHSPSRDADAPEPAAPALAPALYVALENSFRGSEDSIRKRLSHHLPPLQSLPALQTGLSAAEAPTHGVVDLGSGRGEWLSLLAEHGIRAVGIDTNPANIEHCRAHQLNVVSADALTWLSAQPDNSIGAITAFHLIEHLPFAAAHELVAQAMRCLMPGGLLLLETPNPENVLVASSSFHLDPTHLKPLPPALTEFLLDYCGFVDIRTERLHPVAEHLMLPDSGDVSRRCNHLFYGAQDYAVTGSKPHH